MQGSEATESDYDGRGRRISASNIMQTTTIGRLDRSTHDRSKEPSSMNTVEQYWPALPLQEWEATYRTLHMWTQIVGKIRLALTPLQNHFWNVALYVTTRGLTTSPIPYRGGTFEIQFDFVNHRLELRRDGAEIIR